ncbi:MAG TPA: hypothetical protein RMI62_20150 [Polyangiaceae bacterium LLY-WYZ-15_(1-7)]|nr:hypothetical protein [Polyangiaceae bacterium LLY-WYZ-15_(1-7)]
MDFAPDRAAAGDAAGAPAGAAVAGLAAEGAGEELRQREQAQAQEDGTESVHSWLEKQAEVQPADEFPGRPVVGSDRSRASASLKATSARIRITNSQSFEFWRLDSSEILSPPALPQDHGEGPGIAVSAFYENERRDIEHTAWGKFRLPSDLHRWSDLSGSFSAPTLEDMTKDLPADEENFYWEWSEEWHVDLGFADEGLTDEEGFCYAAEWKPWLVSHDPGSSVFPSGHSVCRPADFVRRRRWCRTRVLRCKDRFAVRDKTDFMNWIESNGISPIKASGEAVVNTVVDYVFENERRDIRFTAWGSAHLPHDPERWSDVFGKRGSPIFWDVSTLRPPQGWQWLDAEWEPDRSLAAEGKTDKNGWCYGIDFVPWMISKANKPPFPVGSKQPNATHFCRRRRWVRRRTVLPSPASSADGSEEEGDLVAQNWNLTKSIREELTSPGRWPFMDAVGAQVPKLETQLERTISMPELRIEKLYAAEEPGLGRVDSFAHLDEGPFQRGGYVSDSEMVVPHRRRGGKSLFPSSFLAHSTRGHLEMFELSRSRVSHD